MIPIPSRARPPVTHEQQIAYILLRLVLGINLFGHGSIRILHGTASFATGLLKEMGGTPLPPVLVSLFGYAIPWLELFLGSALILGFMTRWALTGAMCFMAMLMLGITLRQDWPTAALQLGYAFVIFALMYLRESCEVSWLELLRSRSPEA